VPYPGVLDTSLESKYSQVPSIVGLGWGYF